MRVMVLGLRGFPNVQGGVERHAENLYPRLAKLGCKIEIICRSPYQAPIVGGTWHGIKFIRIWSPRSKRLEAIVHTFIGICYAAIMRPDILHIHAIGPSLLVPFARFFGLAVVVTHHGPDYDRQKWGVFAKKMLELGERMGMYYSNARIVISNVIRNLVSIKYQKDSFLIPNGVQLPVLSTGVTILDSFDLRPERYILLVSRLVPEKRHLDLIKAFSDAKLEGWKLVLVGGADHPDDYVLRLQDIVSNTPRVVMTGYQSGDALNELYTHAGFFVLPSSHEGLPIAMLEALSYGLPVVASDIAANLELGLSEHCYFPLADTVCLSRKLKEFAERPLNIHEKQQLREWVGRRYNWTNIASDTLAVYRSVLECLR